MAKYKFNIHGMHCRSCTLLTENELRVLPGVEKVKASFENATVEITGDFGTDNPEMVADNLSRPLKKLGYSLCVEKEERHVNWKEFKTAIPFAAGFMLFFVLLQKIGIVNLINSGNVDYGTAFAIGIIASLSTCMAVVGGLALSVSANFAKEGNKVRPQILFHVGRIISFFILGGLVGAVGSAFRLGINGTFVLNLVVGAVMLVLGINLLDVFPWTKKIQPTLPRFLSKHALGLKELNHSLTPLLVGIITFFLPCGFTQSMQLYALSTANFWTGAVIMLSFALGTLPVLSVLSFTSLGISRSKSGIFFKTAGLVVILFSIFNLFSSLAAMGIVSPLFSF